MKLKAGVKKDGTLTALQLTGLGEVGAYPSDASVGYQIGELYKCPNVHIEETHGVYQCRPATGLSRSGLSAR